jgi:ribosomal protein S18 acetylase RimI-like enzyme
MADIDIRWTVRRDFGAICAFEEASWRLDAHRQGSPMLREEDFVRWVRQSHCIGMSAQIDRHIAGSMIYSLQRRSIDLLYMVVDPLQRRLGVGTAMMNKLRSKLSRERRSTLHIMVSERNVAAQLFLRSLHIPCVKTYTEMLCSDDMQPQHRPADDVYEFQHRYSSAPAADGVLELRCGQKM